VVTSCSSVGGHRALDKTLPWVSGSKSAVFKSPYVIQKAYKGHSSLPSTSRPPTPPASPDPHLEDADRIFFW
jgi:hypothetical protein